MFLSTALGAALLCITGVSADSQHDGLHTNKQLDCYKESECRFLKTYQCKPGYKNVGFDRSICGRPFNGQPICCSTETVQSFGNKRCEWKGFGPNCNGAGEAGEVNLFKSGNGGYPTEGNRGLSDDQCHTGYKYFACPLPHWQELVSGCRVTGCDEGCGTDENEITSLRNDEPSRCDYPTVGKKYCCKKQDEAPLSNCHWVGRGHCDDNTCNPDEVTALRNKWGDTSTCSFNRQKSLCCTPGRFKSKPEPQQKSELETCGYSACDWEDGLCDLDDYYDGPDDDARLEDRSDQRNLLYKSMVLKAKGYPGSSKLHKTRNGADAMVNSIKLSSASCSQTGIEKVNANSLTDNDKKDNWATEHAIELQFMLAFLKAVETNILPSGRTISVGKTDLATLQADFITDSLSSPQRATKRSRKTRNPSTYMFEAIGSYTNRNALFLVSRSLNGRKALIFGSRQLVDEVKYTKFVKTAVQTGAGEKKILQPLREAIAVWRYLHEPEVNRRVQVNRRLLRTTVENISNDVSSLKLLAPVFDEMEQDYWNKAVIWTLTWLNTAMKEVEDTYQQALKSGASPSNWNAVEKALKRIKKDMVYVKTLDKI